MNHPLKPKTIEKGIWIAPPEDGFYEVFCACGWAGYIPVHQGLGAPPPPLVCGGCGETERHQNSIGGRHR